MSRTRILRVALALSATLCGAVEAATVQHAEPLRGYRVNARGGAEKPTGREAAVLSFNAFSRDFTLELEPNGRLAAESAHLGRDLGVYRGKVAGNPVSWVRIVLSPAGPSGLLFDGEHLFGIEAGSSSSEAPTMFRLADVYFAPGELGCEIAAAEIDGERAVAAIAQELASLAAPGAPLNLNLGAVADFEFAQAFGAGAEAALLTRFNNVDGIFSEQLGVQITVGEVAVFTTNNDPFTTTSANALLDEVANYRGATPAQEAQGLTHLLTGRDLAGSTAGIAFIGAVCSTRPSFDTRSFGAALSEARRGTVIDSLVAAHEIGHTFGAPHDGDANGPCAATPTTFLMAPSVNGSDRFSPCSLEQMQAEVATASCLTPIGAANVAVTLPATAGDVFAGATFARTATVLNEGADPATGVTFTATAEPGLTIAAADAGGASCTTSAGSATCTLGSVGGGASRSVTLTLNAASVGTFELAAAVAADSDADAGDNSAQSSITALPLVDLALSGGSAPGVQLNAQTTLSATLANASDFAATSVAVVATLSGGLRPDQAALGGTACSIAGQALSCPARALAARESVTLIVTATGIGAGGQQLTVSASANEAEGSPADNQIAIAVTVNAAPAEQSGGGGGMLSWWGVFALLAALRLRVQSVTGRRRPS